MFPDFPKASRWNAPALDAFGNRNMYETFSLKANQDGNGGKVAK